MKKLLFIANPISGKGQIKSKLMDVIQILTNGGYDVTVRPTVSSDDARTTAFAYARDYDVIACAGGDGTLNNLISGLMCIEKEARPPVGYIPLGTTNDFAIGHRIPRNTLKAAQLIVDGTAQDCDIGSFNSSYFTYSAALGIFTQVSYKTKQSAKNILGHLAYVLSGIEEVFDVKSFFLDVKSEQCCIQDKFIFGMITNSDTIGGFKGICGKDVLMNDGLFEVALIKAPKNPLEFTKIMNALAKKDLASLDLCRFRTSEVRFSSPGNSVAWAIDGEAGGSPPEVLIKNNKHAIKIIK